jgi:hypothetical protein
LLPPLLLTLLSVPVVLSSFSGMSVPFVAWVVMGAGAGYSISGSV